MDLHISSDPIFLHTLISYLYYDLSLLILVLFYFFPPEFLPLWNFLKLSFYLICRFSFCSVVIHRCHLLCSNETAFISLSYHLVWFTQPNLTYFYSIVSHSSVLFHYISVFL